MSDENNNGMVRYTVKELLQRIEQRLDSIESKLDEKASISHVSALEMRMSALENTSIKFSSAISDLDLLDERVSKAMSAMLTKENVKFVVRESLQDAEARGWTKRERYMGVGLFAIAIASFLLNILTLGPDYFK